MENKLNGLISYLPVLLFLFFYCVILIPCALLFDKWLTSFVYDLYSVETKTCFSNQPQPQPQGETK